MGFYRSQALRWMLVGVALQPLLAVDLRLKDAAVQVYFSPDGGAENAIVEAIEQTRGPIWVLAYTFTSKPVAQALEGAHERGVQEIVIFDKSEAHVRGGAADYLKQCGISVFIDPIHAIAHNKVVILSNETVITGSMNWTFQGEHRNAENLLILHDRGLASIYTENFKKLLNQSVRY